MVGELAGEDDAEAAGEEFGEATEAVDRRDAAIVRRRWDSVLSVAVMMHPKPLVIISIRLIAHRLSVPMVCGDIPGHPAVQHHSSSSLTKHCIQTNALLASPKNASSKSAFLLVQSVACASDAARRKSCTTGMVSACRRSRWRSHVSLVSASLVEAWKAQKLYEGKISQQIE